MASPCCPAGSAPLLAPSADQAEPVGTIAPVPPAADHMPMDCYLTGVPLASARRAVLIVSDVYGFTSGNHRQFADRVAAALADEQAAVVLPDLFRGNPAMQPWFPGCLGKLGELLGTPGMLCRLKWTYNHATTIERDVVGLLLPWLRASCPTTAGLSCVGFCFGGWAISKLLALPDSPFRAGIGIHPALTLEKLHGGTEDAMGAAIGDRAVMFLPAGNDSPGVKPGGSVVAMLAAARGVADSAVSVSFEEMVHGWVTRGDPTKDEAVARDQARALDLAVGFIREHCPAAAL